MDLETSKRNRLWWNLSNQRRNYYLKLLQDRRDQTVRKQHLNLSEGKGKQPMQPNWEASSIRSGGPVNPRRNSEGRQPQEPQRNRAFGSGPPDEDPDDFGSDGGSDRSNHEPEETGNPPQGRNFGGGNDLYNLQFANLRTPPPAKFNPKGKTPVRE